MDNLNLRNFSFLIESVRQLRSSKVFFLSKVQTSRTLRWIFLIKPNIIQKPNFKNEPDLTFSKVNFYKILQKFFGYRISFRSLQTLHKFPPKHAWCLFQEKSCFEMLAEAGWRRYTIIKFPFKNPHLMKVGKILSYGKKLVSRQEYFWQLNYRDHVFTIW